MNVVITGHLVDSPLGHSACSLAAHSRGRCDSASMRKKRSKSPEPGPTNASATSANPSLRTAPTTSKTPAPRRRQLPGDPALCRGRGQLAGPTNGHCSSQRFLRAYPVPQQSSETLLACPEHIRPPFSRDILDRALQPLRAMTASAACTASWQLVTVFRSSVVA